MSMTRVPSGLLLLRMLRPTFYSQKFASTMRFHVTATEMFFVYKHGLLCHSFIAARALATYLIPGCVGRGVKLGSESSSGGAGAGGGAGNLSVDLEIWEFGDLGTWKSRNVGSKKSRKSKFSKSKSVLPIENVGKVWISRKTILLVPFGAISGIFSTHRKNVEKKEQKNHAGLKPSGTVSSALV